MATKGVGVGIFRRHAKVNRPGVHSKNNNSIHKKSKNYVKRNVGQGK
jgi:hypothetical protein